MTIIMLYVHKQKMPMFVCPSVALEKIIVLHPELFTLPLTDGTGHLSVPIPCTLDGPEPINLRLISYELRVGQVRLSVYLIV